MFESRSNRITVSQSEAEAIYEFIYPIIIQPLIQCVTNKRIVFRWLIYLIQILSRKLVPEPTARSAVRGY